MYDIINVEPLDTIDDEQMGSKRKFWIKVPGKPGRWLFKFARPNTGEAWSEKVAAEVADLLSIPHAEVEMGSYDGQPGSLSRRFPELETGTVELIHGNELLAGQLRSYDRDKTFRQTDHTLRNILSVVKTLFPGPTEQQTALVQLGGYVLLDALIMNTDRHHENWAALRTTHANGNVVHRIAPTYDHASSLGRELLPQKLAQFERANEALAMYVSKARGAIFIEGQKRGANPIEIAYLLHRYDSKIIEPWLNALSDLQETSLEEVVERIPAVAISEQSKDFAVSLMKHTRRVLLDLE